MTWVTVSDLRAGQEAVRGSLFVANLSGGKDSQAMLLRMLKIVPRGQILAIHAHLGEVAWPGTLEHAQQHAQHAGVAFLVARAQKTLLEMVETRFATRPEVPSWPSPQFRQCTSDLKRGPLNREIRRYAKAQGYTRVINCTGIRREESPQRSKLGPWRRQESECSKTREWLEWLPIFELSTQDVWTLLRESNQTAHPAYAQGNTRMSCVFCLMGSEGDLRNGARLNPELFEKYAALEDKTGYTLSPNGKTLRQRLSHPAPITRGHLDAL